MDTRRTGYERMETVDGNVEHGSGAGGAAIHDGEAKWREREGFLLDAVAFGLLGGIARVQRSEPAAHPELLEQPRGSRKITALAMERMELARRGARQAREAVVALQQ